LLFLLRPGHQPAKKRSRSVEPRSDRSDRTSHDVGYLLVAVLLDIGENHDLALLGGKLGERLGQRLSELTRHVVLDGVDGQGPLSSRVRVSSSRKRPPWTSLTLSNWTPSSSMRVENGGIDPGVTTLGPVVSKLNAATSTPGFFPNGVALRASGDSQFLAETISSMSIALLTSFALVYVLMVILYGSFFTPAVIMLSVPVALVGALFMLSVTHQSLNLFSMIGIIMLFGLVAKNGILLVDYANTMRKRGMRAVDAMRAAAGTRLRPIVMTTAAMVFGMLPLSLGLAEGAEFRRSMGTVLIGGLLSSLILTLFLVPVVYSWVVAWLESRADKRALLHEHEDEFSPPAPRIPAGAMGD